MKTIQETISDLHLEESVKLLTDLGHQILAQSTECLCRPIRQNKVEVSKIKDIFAKYGVELKDEIPF